MFKFIFMLLLSSHEPGFRDLALPLSFDVFITRGGGGGGGGGFGVLAQFPSSR